MNITQIFLSYSFAIDNLTLLLLFLRFSETNKINVYPKLTVYFYEIYLIF